MAAFKRLKTVSSQLLAVATQLLAVSTQLLAVATQSSYSIVGTFYSGIFYLVVGSFC